MDERDTAQWSSGNELELLENGEEYYPKVFAAVEGAAEEIIIETYIWYEDDVGKELADKLVAAARRGVAVTATVDGYGSRGFSASLLRSMTGAGINMCTFDMVRNTHLLTGAFCRLHRKVVVVDGKVAFVGGINVWQLHLRRYGNQSMQDYAVRVTGPVVESIRAETLEGGATAAPSRLRRWRNKVRRVPRESTPTRDGGRAAFVTRDNRDRPNAIEAMYRNGIRAARREILIANAYFFPGYGFMRDLAQAAHRGVDVRLILQGNPDVAVSAFAASILYNYLFAAGIRIFHYTERPLHAKVAVIDDAWVTVGSSNLDPISFGLNIESNLFALDENLARDLRSRLMRLIDEACVEVTTEVPKRSLFRRLLLLVIYHSTRHMSRWGSFVLRRRQTTHPMRP